jgi:hypothetical protein
LTALFKRTHDDLCLVQQDMATRGLVGMNFALLESNLSKLLLTHLS